MINRALNAFLVAILVVAGAASAQQPINADNITRGTLPTARIANNSIGTAKLGGDITTFAETLLQSADAPSTRTALGLGTMSTEAAADYVTTALSASQLSSNSTGDRARANHTGTQLASTISDFAASTRTQTAAQLVAGPNVTITPGGSGATATLTISAAGGSTGGGTGGSSDADIFGTSNDCSANVTAAAEAHVIARGGRIVWAPGCYWIDNFSPDNTSVFSREQFPGTVTFRFPAKLLTDADAKVGAIGFEPARIAGALVGGTNVETNVLDFPLDVDLVSSAGATIGNDPNISFKVGVGVWTGATSQTQLVNLQTDNLPRIKIRNGAAGEAANATLAQYKPGDLVHLHDAVCPLTNGVSEHCATNRAITSIIVNADGTLRAQFSGSPGVTAYDGGAVANQGNVFHIHTATGTSTAGALAALLNKRSFSGCVGSGSGGQTCVNGTNQVTLFDMKAPTVPITVNTTTFPAGTYTLTTAFGATSGGWAAESARVSNVDLVRGFIYLSNHLAYSSLYNNAPTLKKWTGQYKFEWTGGKFEPLETTYNADVPGNYARPHAIQIIGVPNARINDVTCDRVWAGCVLLYSSPGAIIKNLVSERQRNMMTIGDSLSGAMTLTNCTSANPAVCTYTVASGSIQNNSNTFVTAAPSGWTDLITNNTQGKIYAAYTGAGCTAYKGSPCSTSAPLETVLVDMSNAPVNGTGRTAWSGTGTAGQYRSAPAGLGYGVSVRNASAFVEVLDITCKSGGRHCVTSDASDITYVTRQSYLMGAPTYVHIDRGFSYGAHGVSFDTHEEARFWRFTNMNCYWPQRGHEGGTYVGGCMQLRNADVVVDGLRSEGGTFGIRLANLAGDCPSPCAYYLDNVFVKDTNSLSNGANGASTGVVVFDYSIYTNKPYIRFGKIQCEGVYVCLGTQGPSSGSSTSARIDIDTLIARDSQYPIDIGTGTFLRARHVWADWSAYRHATTSGNSNAYVCNERSNASMAATCIIDSLHVIRGANNILPQAVFGAADGNSAKGYWLGSSNYVEENPSAISGAGVALLQPSRVFTRTASITQPYIVSTTATPTIAAGVGAGTGATLAIAGTQEGGTITLTAGSSPSASAVVATVTVPNPCPTVIQPVLDAANDTSASLTGAGRVFSSSAAWTANTFTLNSGATGLTAANQYVWSYRSVCR